MKLFSVLIALGMLGAATASDTAHAPKGQGFSGWLPQDCINLCTKAYPGHGSECEGTCYRCQNGLEKGYLPKTLRAVPPDCKAVCGQDQLCNEQCGAYQASCCHSAFGCCPYDARLCVCVQNTILGC